MNEQEKLPDALPYYSIVGQADYNDPWRRGYACCIEWQKKQDDKYYQYALDRIKKLEGELEDTRLRLDEEKQAGIGIMRELKKRLGELSQALAAKEAAEKERDLWKADAELNMQNKDYWRDKATELEKTSKELFNALRQYEMDVDDDAPEEHKDMMRRAYKVLGLQPVQEEK